MAKPWASIKHKASPAQRASVRPFAAGTLQRGDASTLNVEQALRVIHEKAAALRYLAESGATGEPPDAVVLRGISEVAEDIEQLSRRVTLALGAEALDIDLPRA